MPILRAGLDETRTASAAVVEAVAEAEGVPPTDLEQPLHHSVDADALNALCRSNGDSPGRTPCVSFRYAGYDVTVWDGNEVVVRESADDEVGWDE